MGESEGGRKGGGGCNQNRVKISTFSKVVEEGWRRGPRAWQLRRVCSSRRGAQGGHRGTGGFAVLRGSREHPGLWNQESELLRADGEGRVGSRTAFPPPRESANDKSFKQTALNWNYGGIYSTLGEAPLGGPVVRRFSLRVFLGVGEARLGVRPVSPFLLL